MSVRQNLRPLGIMKLSGTVGVTPTKWWFFWYWCTCLPDFWIWRHLSINFISVRNEASKSIQKLCANSKDIMHKMNTPQKFESERQLRTITKTMTERFLVSESLQTHPRRESGENIYFASEKTIPFSLMLLLVFLLLLLLRLLFNHLLISRSLTPKRQEG